MSSLIVAHEILFDHCFHTHTHASFAQLCLCFVQINKKQKVAVDVMHWKALTFPFGYQNNV